MSGETRPRRPRAIEREKIKENTAAVDALDAVVTPPMAFEDTDLANEQDTLPETGPKFDHVSEQKETQAHPIPDVREDPIDGSRYRDLRVIGQGGQGVVFRAVREYRDETGNTHTQDVVIKTIHYQLLDTEASFEVPYIDEAESIIHMAHDWQEINGNLSLFLDHLQREKTAIQELTQATPDARVRLAQIIGDGSVELVYPEKNLATVGVVMEYIDGDDLKKIRLACQSLAKESKDFVDLWRVHDETLMFMAEHLGEGIAHIHEAGLTHRDMKESNVVVDQEGNLVICDYALAKKEDIFDIPQTSANDSTLPKTNKGGFRRPGQEDPHTRAVSPIEIKHPDRSITISGTPEYMPPEFLSFERQPNAQVRDLYALGITLYSFRAGQTPFEDEYEKQSLSRAIAHHRMADPPPLQPDLELQTPIEACIMALIQRDPRARTNFEYKGANYPIGTAKDLLKTLRDLQTAYGIVPSDALFHAYNAHKQKETKST